MKQRFKHKRAVITGAGSGLGRALALHLARDEWRILAVDINDERARETMEQVRKAGGDGEPYQCDVSNFPSMQAMADYVYSNWQGVDLLVNNAGVVVAGEVGDVPIEDWHFIMNVNLWGVIYGCHAFIPGLRRQRSGHIVNIASCAGIACAPEMGPYNVSKAGVISLSETMRCELKAHSVGVSVVCPTFFPTQLLESLRAVSQDQMRKAEVLFEKSLMTAEDVARHIVKGVQRNKLYIIPQIDGKLLWGMKRLAPGTYSNSVSFLKARGLIDKYLLR